MNEELKITKKAKNGMAKQTVQVQGVANPV